MSLRRAVLEAQDEIPRAVYNCLDCLQYQYKAARITANASEHTAGMLEI